MNHLYTLISLIITQLSNEDYKGLEKTALRFAKLAKKLGARWSTLDSPHLVQATVWWTRKIKKLVRDAIAPKTTFVSIVTGLFQLTHVLIMMDIAISAQTKNKELYV